MVGIFLWVLFDARQQEKSSLKNADRGSTVQNNKKRTQPRRTPIKDKSKLKFKEYEQAYKNSEKDLSKIPVEKDDCVNAEGPVKYSWIELIFLQRTDKGTYKPFNPSGISIDYTETKSCQSPSHGFAGPASARFLYPVIKNCECVSVGFKPDTKYKLEEIGNYGIVNHQLSVPPSDKFYFATLAEERDVTPADSKREPTPYKFPIVVNNLKKKDQHWSHKDYSNKTIKFYNVPERVTTKTGTIVSVDVKYLLNGSLYQTNNKIHDGTYKLEIEVPEGKEITGGSVVVEGRVERLRVPEFAREKKSLQKQFVGVKRKYLLLYKSDVQSRTVDMSEGLGYEYSQTDAIKRTFEVSTLISSQRLEKLKKRKGDIVAALIKAFNGTERLSIVNWVTCYEKDGSIFARLEALPGNYELVVGDDEYTYNIKWPPERFPDTHDDSK